jgi:hypothetical protein
MSNDFVTIASYSFLPPAQLLKGELEAEGISCFINEVNTVGAMPFNGASLGGINVRVQQRDVERASKVLERIKDSNKELKKQIDELWAKGFTEVDMYCPSCESAAVYRKKLPKSFVIPAFILAPVLGLFYIPLLFIKRIYTCADCGHTWKQKLY